MTNEINTSNCAVRENLPFTTNATAWVTFRPGCSQKHSLSESAFEKVQYVEYITVRYIHDLNCDLNCITDK